MKKAKEVALFSGCVSDWPRGAKAEVMLENGTGGILTCNIKKSELKGIAKKFGDKFVVRLLQRGRWYKAVYEPMPKVVVSDKEMAQYERDAKKLGLTAQDDDDY